MDRDARGDRLVLSSDLGRASAPSHAEAMRMLLRSLLDVGRSSEHAVPEFGAGTFEPLARQIEQRAGSAQATGNLEPEPGCTTLTSASRP